MGLFGDKFLFCIYFLGRIEFDTFRYIYNTFFTQQHSNINTVFIGSLDLQHLYIKVSLIAIPVELAFYAAHWECNLCYNELQASTGGGGSEMYLNTQSMATY